MKSRPKKKIAFVMTGIFSVVFIISCSTKVNFLTWGGFSRSDEPKSSFRGSIAQFVSGVRPQQGNPDSHYLLACYFQERGEHEKAIEEFEKVLLIEPKHVRAHNGMGVSYDQVKDYPRAVESYRRALRLDPNLDYVLNNLGYSYLLQGLPDEAIPALQKAVALNGEEGRFHNNLGLAYAVKGQLDLALDEFKLAGEESRAHFNVAQFYYKRGLYRVAQFHYSQALKLDPSFVHARLTGEAIIALARIFQPAEGPKETTSTLPSSPMAEPGGNPLPAKEPEGSELAAAASGRDRENNPTAPSNSEAAPSLTAKNQPWEENMTRGLHDPGRRDNGAAQISAPAVVSKTEAAPLSDPSQLAGQKPFSAKSVGIEVSNGNGVNGMARRISQQLKDKGLPVSRITNAGSFNRRRTMIYYLNGYQEAAVRVADQIPGLQDIEEQKKFDRPYINVKVVIGKDILSDKAPKGGRRS